MPQSFSVRPRVEIDGTALTADIDTLLEEVIVDDHLHLPDMFVLVFRDTAHDVLSRLSVKIGSAVKISSAALGGDDRRPLMSGEVTSLEADYGPSASRVLVRGYDKAHRLHRGRRTETYRNAKDSDIATQVAQRAGLQAGQVDDSVRTHDHVSQANLSDWDFLKARAAEIGFEVGVEDGKLNFKKPDPAREAPSSGDFHNQDPLQLVLGQDLLEFRPRVTSAEQVKEVKVRGWDVANKQAVVGSAPAGTTSAALSQTPAELAHVYGDPVFTAVDRPLSTQAEADAVAAAIADQIGSAHAEAEGVARGNPRLLAGTAVSVGVVGKSFEGRYTLSHTRHRFASDGYTTQFTVSGRQERSLLGLVGGGGGNAGNGGGPQINGVVVAVVTGNDDPLQQARVKVKFPWLADGYESDWARVSYPGAGKDRGLYFVPEVGDEVLVAFEFGDIRRPFVVGGLNNGKDKPRLGDGLVDNGKVKRRGVVSSKGHRLVFMDADGKSGIALLTSDGKIKVALKESDGELHLYCDGKIHLEATGALKLETRDAVEIKGSQGVKISSDAGNVEITGTLVKLN